MPSLSTPTTRSLINGTPLIWRRSDKWTKPWPKVKRARQTDPLSAIIIPIWRRCFTGAQYDEAMLQAVPPSKWI